MFELLRKNNLPEKSNESVDFLDVENSALNMDANSNTFSDNVNYQDLVYQEPVYDAPSYKARNDNIEIVVDSDAIGFDKNSFNPNITTIDIFNDDENNNMNEVNTQELVADSEIGSTNMEIRPAELLDVIDIGDSNTTEPLNIEKDNNQTSIFQVQDTTINDSQKKIDDSDKFSIFGSNDGITNVNQYNQENLFEEPKLELEQQVEYTEDGYKICPNCGTILNPKAPVCFMCSKSFVLTK